MENIPIESLVVRPMSKGGRPKGTTNVHSKHPSGIAYRLKAAGIDWVIAFGAAIQANDRELLSLWVKLLPYLVVTGGPGRRVKKFKGHASKAALQALHDLEGE